VRRAEGEAEEVEEAQVSGHIVAIGGGSFFEPPEDPRLNAFILALAGVERPRVCFIPTASGDSQYSLTAFYRGMAHHDCRPADLVLFDRTVEDIPAFVAEQDVFWVWGGSTLNLLALWRLHGLDEPLREAYERGAVLCGISAGMNCWFESCTTDSYGLTLAPLHDGLGFLAGSACPHYDGEPQRRPLYRRLVDEGALAPGWAADNDVALHFSDGELVEAVALSEGVAAYRVEPGSEVRIAARLLE
jgi:peptidase E